MNTEHKMVTMNLSNYKSKLKGLFDFDVDFTNGDFFTLDWVVTSTKLYKGNPKNLIELEGFVEQVFKSFKEAPENESYYIELSLKQEVIGDTLISSLVAIYKD